MDNVKATKHTFVWILIILFSYLPVHVRFLQMQLLSHKHFVISYIQTDDGEDDLKKGTQLLEIYALEIQMYTAQVQYIIHDQQLKALRGRGSHKPNIFQGTMNQNWNFQKRCLGVCEAKTLHVWGIDIFLNHTSYGMQIWSKLYLCVINYD